MLAIFTVLVCVVGRLIIVGTYANIPVDLCRIYNIDCVCWEDNCTIFKNLCIGDFSISGVLLLINLSREDFLDNTHPRSIAATMNMHNG